MTILNLSEIFNAYTNKQIDKDSAIDYFKSIIENKDDILTRKDAVEILGKIDSNSIAIFKYLENLLISDTNGDVRAKAAKIIIENYQEKAYEPIKWTLERENYHSCIEIITNALFNCSDSSLKSLLNSINHVIYDNTVYIVKNNSLDLSGIELNKIKDIKKLETLKSLLWLNLSNNKIKEIEGLDALVNLKFLALGTNFITEIKGLENLKNLEALHLNDNKIKEITGLNKLTNLRSLNLNNNKISEIKNIETLIKLNHLTLSNNSITEIKNIEYLENLVILQLNNNCIQEINELGHLKRLTTLNLCNNKIQEIKDPNLPNLYYFSLDYNPIPHHQLKEFYKKRRKIIDFRYL